MKWKIEYELDFMDNSLPIAILNNYINYQYKSMHSSLDLVVLAGLC